MKSLEMVVDSMSELGVEPNTRRASLVAVRRKLMANLVEPGGYLVKYSLEKKLLELVWEVGAGATDVAEVSAAGMVSNAAVAAVLRSTTVGLIDLACENEAWEATRAAAAQRDYRLQQATFSAIREPLRELDEAVDSSLRELVDSAADLATWDDANIVVDSVMEGTPWKVVDDHCALDPEIPFAALCGSVNEVSEAAWDATMAMLGGLVEDAPAISDSLLKQIYGHAYKAAVESSIERYIADRVWHPVSDRTDDSITSPYLLYAAWGVMHDSRNFVWDAVVRPSEVALNAEAALNASVLRLDSAPEPARR